MNPDLILGPAVGIAMLWIAVRYPLGGRRL
jgi:hypothetical protein